MANKIQVRQGPRADLNSVVLDVGEPGYVTDEQRAVMGDGITAGGVALPRLDEVAITEDAPADTTQYVRRNGEWEPLATSALVYELITENVTAAVGVGYLVDASAGEITLQLPEDAAVGQRLDVTIINATNPVTLSRNGQPIYGAASDIVLTTVRDHVALVWSGASYGWASAIQRPPFSTDAPTDGGQYVRQSGVWAPAAGLAVPAGTVITFAANTPPAGYLTCYGQAVSRTTYSALFNAIGLTFGLGDGDTTFNLPDLRGEFIRGWSDARAVDTGREFGSAQAHQLEDHEHPFGFTDGATANYGPSGVGRHSPTGIPSTGNHGDETRPRNLALLYCIKI